MSEFKILNPTDRVIVYIFRLSYIIVLDQIPDKTWWSYAHINTRMDEAQ